MKKTIVVLAALAVLSGVNSICRAEKLTADTLRFLAGRFQYFLVLEPTGDQPLRYVYADVGPHVHVYEVKDGKARSAWESGNLGAPVSALQYVDLDKDGRWSILVATLSGRLVAFDATNYERVWENFQEPFRSIQCVAAYNLDRDPQDEVVIVGEGGLSTGSFVFIFDSVTRGVEWKSQQSFLATEILIGNVDSDPQPEIILNSGYVIDSRFYNIDLIKTDGGGFGESITLQDLNDDGYPEVIGRVPNRSLKVYDIYAERDIW